MINILINGDKEPPNLKLFGEITKNSYGCFDLDNTFEIFNSVNDLILLVYSTKSRSLICYDLLNFYITVEIKNCHKAYITNIRHYLDINNKRDLIISISDRDNNLKLWNINNYEWILELKHINNAGFLCSACLLSYNSKIYIISSNCNMLGESEKIKIYDLEGKIINQMNDSNEKVYFIDSFYNKMIDKIYLITGNYDYVKSYDFQENALYKIYFNNEESGIHVSIKVFERDNILSLIESCSFGYLRIWNFHSAELLKKIKIDDDWIFGICLWNEDFAFVSCKNKIIKLVDLSKGLIFLF